MIGKFVNVYLRAWCVTVLWISPGQEEAGHMDKKQNTGGEKFQILYQNSDIS